MPPRAENMGGHYEVTLGMMRATLRWARGEATRLEVRKALEERGYTRAFIGGYLDMVRRAMTQVENSATKENNS